jgi:glycosyltransferase involved in cell wall biosynthesis
MCEAAIEASTPLWVIGKPYADDAYARRFISLVDQSGGLIRYEGAITQPSDLAPILKSAHGFVLLSTMETQSIAASAAAAAGCPLFLSDLPWARHSFEDRATYCPLSRDARKTATLLKQFYNEAPDSPAPPAPHTWDSIAKQLKGIYEETLT